MTTKLESINNFLSNIDAYNRRNKIRFNAYNKRMLSGDNRVNRGLHSLLDEALFPDYARLEAPAQNPTYVNAVEQRFANDFVLASRALTGKEGGTQVHEQLSHFFSYLATYPSIIDYSTYHPDIELIHRELIRNNIDIVAMNIAVRSQPVGLGFQTLVDMILLKEIEPGKFKFYIGELKTITFKRDFYGKIAELSYTHPFSSVQDNAYSKYVYATAQAVLPALTLLNEYPLDSGTLLGAIVINVDMNRAVIDDVSEFVTSSLYTQVQTYIQYTTTLPTFDKTIKIQDKVYTKEERLKKELEFKKKRDQKFRKKNQFLRGDDLSWLHDY